MICTSRTAPSRLVLSALFLTLVACPAVCEIRLPAIFGSHMVLQRETEAPIWGWGEPAESITINADWLDHTVECQADEKGNWSARIPTGAAGGPYSLSVHGSSSIAFTNVMLGEVWICSGQSNMEMPVDYVGPGYWGVTDYEKEIAEAYYPNLRLFTVQRAIAAEPREDCVGKWQQCGPETVGRFSAVGYFFGRDINQDIGVPVGMICSAWGGTPAQSWTDFQFMKTLPNWAERMADVERLRDNRDAFAAEYQAALKDWREACQSIDKGLANNWMDSEFDDSAWETMHVPGAWSSDDLMDFDGVVWCRTTFELPEEWDDIKVMLELGPIDDWDVVWLNGKKVGAHDQGNVWQLDRKYEIPASVTKAGTNHLAVRVIDTGGKGGIYGRPEQLMVNPAEGIDGRAVPLNGQWRYRIGASINDLPRQPRQQTFNAHTPTSLFNGMIAPLVPYAIRGAIWYQGESNRSDPADYRTLFPTMITCWRDAWNLGDFPFYFVQIAPFNYTLHGHQQSDLAAQLREAQFMTLAAPNTGMAVTMDVGNASDIHPRKKRPVGERLALWAKANTYGRTDLVYSGPLYRQMKIEGDRIRLYFDHIGSGLVAGNGGLVSFTVAGKDGKFVPAQAQIEGDTVIVWHEDIARPVAARYAWSDAPDPNLFNAEGLPASSFRTDMPED